MSTLKLKSQNGSIELSPEDGSGTTNVILPRGGFLGDSGYQWVDETANRAVGTVYTNTTGHPIFISVRGQGNSSAAYFYINGVGVARQSGTTTYTENTLIIPDGDTYELSSGGSFGTWHELK